MIISIGFRVNSKKAIKFITWANEIIKDYMIQGIALDDDYLWKQENLTKNILKDYLKE